MKAGWTPFLMAAAAMAASGAAKPEPDVVVCLHRGPIDQAVIGLAEGEARSISGSAGISLEFALGKPRSHGGAEVIEAEIVEQADARFRPGSLKLATLGTNASTRIEILYNRIRVFRRDDATGHVLAHVSAHEITHVLEGIARHSASGIMKALGRGGL